MNLFQNLVDRWDFITPTIEETAADFSVYCYGLEFICSTCTEKHGTYLGCPKTLREKRTCDWCNKEEICIPVHYAGWPNITNPIIKTNLFKAGEITLI
jgi:hypothetical protein